MASLLLNLCPENEEEMEIIDTEFEENVFWILVHIMYEKGWRTLFSEGTPGVFRILKKFDDTLAEELPEVKEKINGLGLDVYMCFP